jgi:glycine/D-amino acid oxidase-like deaminating enzyme
MASDVYRDLSLWHATLPGSLEPRAPLERDERVDVAIVGAGYTGLWTAYYLAGLAPGIRIAVIDAEIAGFGASGRNGGWCVGTLAGAEALLSDPARREPAKALQRALFDTVDEVGRVCADERIDCHFRKGGYLSVASVPAHRAQLVEEVRRWHSLGFGEDDVRWLDPDEARARVRTPGGRLHADTVVCAAEAYTRTISGRVRRIVPMHSLMIATEPLPEEIWKEIGLERRETFADPRRIVVYGQRTADGRIAFGSRGPYFYGSGIRDRFDPGHPFFAKVRRTLESFFPVLRDFAVTHRWGGALGVPRDWRPSAGLDAEAGLAWAGGYVGEGVAASNLAGRTLADLILRRDSERVRLPLVGPPSPNWEPEPLRWIGVAGLLRIGQSLDAAELAGRRTPRLRNALWQAFVH